MSIKSQTNNMRRLAVLFNFNLCNIHGKKECGPNGSKQVFLNVGKVFLRALARDLGLHDVTVSSNAGGIGVSGECSLIGIVTAKGDDQSTGDISLLVPALSLGKLAGMCKDEDEFRVGTTGKSIVFFKENFLFSARLMEGGYIDTNSLLKTITNSFTVLTDTKEMREALSSVLSVAPDGRVNLAFEDQKLVFRCSSDWGNASVGIDVIALTGAPTGSYWYSAKQLATCLKALGGTITLGIAQGGMLTISTQDAYYLQNVMRAPTAKKKSKKAIEPPAAKAA